jgi:hypothetical protein
MKNIEESDGTVIFSFERVLVAGTKLTLVHANKVEKPMLHVCDVRKKTSFEEERGPASELGGQRPFYIRTRWLMLSDHARGGGRDQGERAPWGSGPNNRGMPGQNGAASA